MAAIVTISSSKMAYFTGSRSVWKNQDRAKQAVTIVTIGQPVFAYFSVIGKRSEIIIEYKDY